MGSKYIETLDMNASAERVKQLINQGFIVLVVTLEDSSRVICKRLAPAQVA